MTQEKSSKNVKPTGTLVETEKTELLLNGIIQRLENGAVDFVEALIDLVAAPERKRSDTLLRDLLVQVWVILEHQEIFKPPSTSNVDLAVPSSLTHQTPYDILIRVLRTLIEEEIFLNLPNIQRHANLHPNSKALHLFWGGLTLHLKLLLPIDPCRGPTLYSNGLVTLPHADSFSCEIPLSESQIHQLITCLGPAFIRIYAEAYIQHEKLRNRILEIGNTHSRKESDPLDLLVQERSLNRYVDKFAKRLALRLQAGCISLVKNPSGRIYNLLASASAESALSQVRTQAASALFIERGNPIPIENRNPHEATINLLQFTFDTEAQWLPVTRSEHLNFDKLMAKIQRSQIKSIRDSIRSVYVPQTLEYSLPQGDIKRHTTLAELVDTIRKRLIFTALPDGGKSRLHQEMILYSGKPSIFHFVINLESFVASGLPSFPRYIAIEMLQQVKENFSAATLLEENLRNLDLNRQIYWHFEGWDELSNSEQSRIAIAFATLSQFNLSSSAPFRVIQIFGAHRIDFDGIVRIQPFTFEQVQAFIRNNFDAPSARAERRARELRGLAQLPGGLEYLCHHLEHETIIELLLGYLNRRFKEMGLPILQLDKPDVDKGKPMECHSDLLADVLHLLRASSFSNRNQTGVLHLEPPSIVPYMGASSLEQNRHLANQRIEQCLRAKLLSWTNKEKNLHFVVPEIGYFLAALSNFEYVSGKHWLDHALREYQYNSENPIYEMMVALASWVQETKLLQSSTFH